ncbi:conjugal transfer protein TrbF [Dickeya dianthicola]|uniref:conjugal transfer protein TrbF n=1 Tax=Dickeya dianthicola TaxID=204039 RepID=UPI0018664FA2|nr:conjugal transfer protein TrbF [Dickeya dianthicola]QOL14238.1 conjugal transfer protein TrbF [Dickeya dianthicola]
MRFRRPQMHYGETPSPATPYQAAAEVWDTRIGTARVQARNWRLMAFGCLLLALLMAAALIWRAMQSALVPYVVEVEKSGEVRAVAPAVTTYQPSEAQIAYHLARFITLVRSLSLDPVVVRQNWLEAYASTTDQGAAVLNAYARAQDPFGRIGNESVTVQIASVVRSSDRSFEVRWSEQHFIHGTPSETERWTAMLTVVQHTPRTEQQLRLNPLGIYINGLSWSRELAMPEGGQP